MTPLSQWTLTCCHVYLVAVALLGRDVITLGRSLGVAIQKGKRMALRILICGMLGNLGALSWFRSQRRHFQMMYVKLISTLIRGRLEVRAAAGEASPFSQQPTWRRVGPGTSWEKPYLVRHTQIMVPLLISSLNPLAFGKVSLNSLLCLSGAAESQRRTVRPLLGWAVLVLGAVAAARINEVSGQKCISGEQRGTFQYPGHSGFVLWRKVTFIICP